MNRKEILELAISKKKKDIKHYKKLLELDQELLKDFIQDLKELDNEQ